MNLEYNLRNKTNTFETLQPTQRVEFTHLRLIYTTITAPGVPRVFVNGKCTHYDLSYTWCFYLNMYSKQNCLPTFALVFELMHSILSTRITLQTWLDRKPLDGRMSYTMASYYYIYLIRYKISIRWNRS